MKEKIEKEKLEGENLEQEKLEKEKLEEEMIKKYDRQIRLFGLEVQKKIKSTPILIFQGISFFNEEIISKEDYSLISGEILKNFVLLGFEEITLNEEVLNSFKRLVPDEISKINENIHLNFVDKSDLTGLRNDYIGVFVDFPCNFVGKNIFFMCSNCFCYHSSFKTHEICHRKIRENNKVYECLLGAIFVHEMVKMIDGKNYQEDFKLEIN